MKRFLLILVIVILFSTLIFSSCTEPAPSPAPAPAPTPSPEPAPAPEQEVFELRYSSPYFVQEPPTMIGQFFCDYIMEHSGGRINVKSYSGSTLASLPEHLELVSSGGADIVTLVINVYEDALPIAGGVTARYNKPIREIVPFVNGLAKDNPETAPIFERDLARQNAKLMTYNSCGEGGWVVNFLPAKSLDDLKGRKMGVQADEPYLEALGVNTVTTNPADVYECLSRGVYDGFGIVIAPMAVLKFHEVSKAIIRPNEFAVTLPQIMNLDTWHSLPPDLQQVCLDAVPATVEFGINLNETMEAQTLQVFKDAGLEINTLSKEDQDTWFKLYFDEWEKHFKQVCERAGVWEDGQVVLKHVKDYAYPK